MTSQLKKIQILNVLTEMHQEEEEGRKSYLKQVWIDLMNDNIQFEDDEE